MVKYTFEVNGKDFHNFVERDSYATSLVPVFSPAITTMDQIDHVVKIRDRASVTVGLNPQTAENTAELCKTLLQAPLTVLYHCMQRNADVFSTMIPDEMSSRFLSRCLAGGHEWAETENITLTEL